MKADPAVTKSGLGNEVSQTGALLLIFGSRDTPGSAQRTSVVWCGMNTSL